ncbi:archaeosine biosynthesis radical SAM protein RaSEA [Caldiplasma sukawensis]
MQPGYRRVMLNREFANKIKKMMPSKKEGLDNNRPVSMWVEKDRINGYAEDTAVVIFRTRGCSWYDFSSCSMCGYFNDVSENVTENNIRNQIDALVDFIGQVRVLKVFTSGSFLDKREVNWNVFHYFMEQMKGRIDTLLVESRTEYITEKNLIPFKGSGIKTRIAIGVESSNDIILKDSVNKGTNFKKFRDAATIVRRMGLEVRSYLLLKPPFISEKEAIKDAINSVEDCSPYSDDVSINPMNIQKNTYVEYLWKKGQYRPPWLWSVAKVLIETSSQGFNVVSYPTGGNSLRGAHNRKPDQNLLSLIFNTSLSQDFSSLENYYNSADKWDYFQFLETEGSLSMNTDFDGFITKVSKGELWI